MQRLLGSSASVHPVQCELSWPPNETVSVQGLAEIANKILEAMPMPVAAVQENKTDDVRQLRQEIEKLKRQIPRLQPSATHRKTNGAPPVR
ncbi:hypothetical protein M514_19349 [Trichuris suis]|uniref:Uncharacterized protein n=1 Tax=Trichuris suis TaxID=68888 RepID=A0A085NGC7_9BILA|nr:hypothetical protein M514_19349 [Trichuris suis]